VASSAAYDSFLGYALNQRTKFLETKDGRPAKYAVTYLRVLYDLCRYGNVYDLYSRNADGPTIVRAKAGSFRTGEVIDLTEQWTKEATRRLARCTHHADRQAVDAFLIRIRSSFLIS